MNSQYEEQIDDNKVICPYCKHEYQPEAEGYSEDAREEECEQCNMKYYIHQVFFTSHVTKPDCELNGQQHKPVQTKLLNGQDYRYCSVCECYLRESK